MVDETWFPAAGGGAERPGDIALLHLDGKTPAPPDALPAPLGPPVAEWDAVPFYAFGFPEHAAGTSVLGVIAGPAGPDGPEGFAGLEWAKLEGLRVTGERILPGFSGAPVWDQRLEVVAGIIVAQNPEPEARVGYMIPVRTLIHYLPGLRDTRRWRLRHDDEALVNHWDPESRGLPGGAARASGLAGWHFSGRAEALARLIRYLTSEDARSALVAVTGAPGSGKSAILARLVTFSDSDYLQIVPDGIRAEAEERSVPPIGAVDLAVHLRGQTAIELARRVIAAAALSGPVPVNEGELADEESLRELGRDLGRRLRESGRPRAFTLVVDALDEARNPKRPNADEPRRVALLLAELAGNARTPALRCVIGTRARSPRLGEGDRSDLLQALGTDVDESDATIDLGRAPYLDAPALRRYVERLLAGTDERDKPASAAFTDAKRARIASAIAAAAATNFLVALLTALAVREAPEKRIAYPKSVGEAFDVYLSNFGERRLRVEALLRALAYAEGAGLAPRDRTWPLIAEAVGDGAFARASEEQDAVEIERFVTADGAYLVQAGAREKSRRGRLERVPIYRLYHQAILDHLRADRHEERQEQIFDCLYDAVPGDDERPDWRMADGYTLRHIVRHALGARDPARLDALLTQPSFCVHADPIGFEPRLLLRARDPDAVGAARVIGRAISRLRRIADPRERAAYLGLSARQAGSLQLAESFDHELRSLLVDDAGALSGRAAWRCRWAVAPYEAAHFPLSGHSGWVNAVSLGSLAGDEVIVSGGSDGTVRVWAADGSARGEPLIGHAGWVTAVAVGRWSGEDVIVSGGADGLVQVWTADGSAHREPLSGHAGRVTSIAIGRLSGEDVIISGGADGLVRVWTAEGSANGEPLTRHADRVTSVAVGRLTGEEVIVSGGSDGTVRVWTAEGRARGGPLTGHAGWVTTVAVGQLGGEDVIVSGGSDGAIRVWCADGSARGAPFTRNGRVEAVALGRLDGEEVVVSGAADGTLRVWAADGSMRGDPLIGPSGWVTSVAVGELAGEEVIVSGDSDGTVLVWAPGWRTPEELLTGDRRSVTAVAVGRLAGDEVTVSGAADGSLRVWTADGSARGEPLTGHRGRVYAIALGQLGGEEVIVSGAADDSVRVRNADGSPRGEPLTGHGGRVYTVALGRLAGDEVIVSGGSDGTVRVWTAEGRARGEPLTGHAGRVYTVALGRLGGEDVIVSGAADGSLRVWTADGNARGGPLIGHDGRVYMVALGRLGGEDVIVSGGADGLVRVWTAEGRARGEPSTGHAGRVFAVALGGSAAKEVIVSGGSDGTVRVWATTEVLTISLGSPIADLAVSELSLLACGAFGIASLEIY